MSRAQYKGNTNICADCSASDPTWASVNRGVLLCDECCSIHRSLGRHISQVKSLRKGSWSPTQLAMVQQLVSLGANNIWEHTLSEPGSSKQSRRKPNPRDPVHPTKADFIRAKYQFLAFVNKHKDSDMNAVDELSKQLHASVRTANLETALRMLSVGGDPNYFHPEKGNSPLHVAAQSGQAAQVELLVIYGADPGAYDSNGKTPVDHARTENHLHLSDRLTECQYELTDKLAFYLCNRKPDHRQGQHFLIPEMADSSLDMSELAKAAKKKLQALSNHLFEELAMDVYDEVDRRENNQIWLQAQSDSAVAETHLVPFLPVNPEFSSTRNQGRQKLARFNNREFATLIIDILSDARRRQLGIISPLSTSSTPSKDKVPRLDGDQGLLKSADTSASDDDPIYDHVASDEDYASIGDNASIKGDKSPTKEKSLESMASSDQSDGPVTLEEYLEVKRALEDSKSRIQLLVQTNRDLKQEITLLRNMVQRLMNERCPEGSEIQNVTNGYEAISEAAQYTRPQPRPQSMFEPRDQKHHAHWRVIQEDTGAASSSAGDKDAKSVSTSQLQSGRMEVYSGGSDYENSVPSLPPRDPVKKDRQSAESARSSGRSDSSHHASTSDSVPSVHSVHSVHSSHSVDATASAGAQGVQGATHMPCQDEVVHKTERITKKIQELLVSAQEGKSRSYSSCADKIQRAVQDMLLLFPQNIKDENVSLALQSLSSGCIQLQEQCITLGSEVARDVDKRHCTQKVIQCAYNIAKAAKQLVILFE